LFDSANTEFRRKIDKHIEFSRAKALESVQRIKEIFPDWQVSAEASAGIPAEELIKSSDDLQPDILVVGSHGRSALGRFFLGSVSQKILHESNCSVRISRRIEKKENSKIHILIAVDGSKNAEATVQTVANRILTENAEIRLIAVDDPFNRPEIGYINWDQLEDKPKENEKSKEWIEKVINKPTQILKSAGLQVSHKIHWGDAANMILQEAEDWNANAIFLGARGLGRIKRFLLGSVSSRVAAQANCSVEVIRI
jgi:nucleotide-binding universal stress UspA family protein